MYPTPLAYSVKCRVRHYMNQEQPQLEPGERRPLALHIELLRQSYGDRGIGQRELAEFLGISPALLRRYEQMRELPKVLEHLIAASYFLGVRTVEGLIAPGRLEEIYTRIDEHLERRGLPQRRNGGRP